MKHLRKIKHSHVSSGKKYFLKSLPTLGVIFLLIGIFFLTKSPTPYVSELAFTEHSSKGNITGSVIPASCESSPPTSHFAGDCVDLESCPNGVARVAMWSCLQTSNNSTHTVGPNTRGGAQAECTLYSWQDYGSGSYIISPMWGTSYCPAPVPAPVPAPAPVPVVTATISASPTSVAPGENSNITWSSTNAKSCVRTGWNVDQSDTRTSGTTGTGPLPTSQTFTIYCVSATTGEPNSSTQSVTVTVVAPGAVVPVVPAPVAVIPSCAWDRYWNGWTCAVICQPPATYNGSGCIMPNQPPIANAGPDTTQTTSSFAAVPSDGASASDPDGGLLTVSWANTSKPVGSSVLQSFGSQSQSMSSGSALPFVTFWPLDTVGIYTFELTVTDPLGATVTDTKTVTVTDAGVSLNLSVTKNGTGIGTVTSNPLGINCGNTCGAQFSSGSVVGLRLLRE